MTGYPCGTNPFCKAYHCALPRSPICLDEHWPPPPLPALVGGTRGMRGWSSPVCKEKILTPLEFTRESPLPPELVNQPLTFAFAMIPSPCAVTLEGFLPSPSSQWCRLDVCSDPSSTWGRTPRKDLYSGQTLLRSISQGQPYL
eukprot:GGOE01046678.1.p1 GENE.GGOE01046678.1~~GGOE01046678.1.p1  ORF type:complete len:143 (+),score=2.61 GGOE01046678.1:232-660(+)